MQDHTKLMVWRKARALSVLVHQLAGAMRPGSVPGLRAQLIRSTLSIATNVAEGASRHTRMDFARFVSMAIASSSETEHHLTVCVDLGIMSREAAATAIERTVEVRRMLCGLQRALNQASKKS